MNCEGHLFFCQCLGDDATKYLIPEDFVREINADELELREAIVIRNYAPVNAKFRELFKLDVVTILNDHDAHFFKVRYDDGTYTFVLKDHVKIIDTSKMERDQREMAERQERQIKVLRKKMLRASEKERKIELAKLKKKHAIDDSKNDATMRALYNELLSHLVQWDQSYEPSYFLDQKIGLETNKASAGGNFLIRGGKRILLAFSIAASLVECVEDATKCLRFLGKFEATTMLEMENFVRWIRMQKEDKTTSSSSSSSSTSSFNFLSTSSLLQHVAYEKKNKTLTQLVDTYSMTGQFKPLSQYKTS
jgi:hypothetical protein